MNALVFRQTASAIFVTPGLPQEICFTMHAKVLDLFYVTFA